jgi:hypothetical protein
MPFFIQLKIIPFTILAIYIFLRQKQVFIEYCDKVIQGTT